MKKKSASRSAFFSWLALFTLALCAGAICTMGTGTPLAVFRPGVPANISQRTLTFAERVAYQQAIEDVYWRHRIWPKERLDAKPPLDAVTSWAQLEKKVADYLRKSQALEDYWQRPLTAEQLQAEMDRMAKHTKQPEVLRELFEALGNDPFVIAECLARPVLAQRFLAELNDRDRVKLTKVAWLKTTLESRPLRAQTQAPKELAAIDSIAEAVQANRPTIFPQYRVPRVAASMIPGQLPAPPTHPMVDTSTRQFGQAVK